MKKFRNLISFLVSFVAMFVAGALSGSFACTVDVPDGNAVQPLGDEGGKVVSGEMSVTRTSPQMDAEYYMKEINKTIVEMKFTGTPIDQILRTATMNKSDSITIKYYSVGQRPLTAVLKTQFTEMSSDTPQGLDLEDNSILGAQDTLLCLNADGSFIPGYKDDSEDPAHPLMIRVHAISSETNKPLVYAVNGKKNGGSNPFRIPTLAKGTILLRMGRAAAEKDVSTGRYYQLPEPTEQYCQRFIMQVEDTIYDRLSKKEIDWSFTRVERMAMEDMRIGMEATGLFGVKSMHQFNSQGNIYTSEGIWYRAGKDLEIGRWVIKTDANGNKLDDGTNYLQEFQITEDDLVDLTAQIIDGAGNGSRTKLVFVDNTIYMALAKIKTTGRVRIFNPEHNYNNWGLDFEAFECMGTKLLFYRHDLFNAWGFNGRAFCLDPEYLDKWVFQDWARHEYDLKALFISNGNAVTMEEFSCWTLSFPSAHARISIPEAEEKPIAAA